MFLASKLGEEQKWRGEPVAPWLSSSVLWQRLASFPNAGGSRPYTRIGGAFQNLLLGTRNWPELTARVVDPLGPTCHFVLDADPAALLLQVQGAPSILGAIMGSLVPVESILHLNDLPWATVHGGILALADQTLANIYTKVRWYRGGLWSWMGKCLVDDKWKTLRGQDCEMQGHSRSRLSRSESNSRVRLPKGRSSLATQWLCELCKLLSFSVPPLYREESVPYSIWSVGGLNEFVHSEYGLFK